MSSFQIIVGSMLGGTEYVGEACEETLIKLGHQVKIHLKPNLKTIISSTFNRDESLDNDQKNISNSPKKIVWLICTSTHGAGDYPDNIKQFVSDLDHCSQDLSTVDFLTIGIGDSSYDTFCKAAIDISNTLKSASCNSIAPLKTIDMSLDIDPEELANDWLLENKDLL